MRVRVVLYSAALCVLLFSPLELEATTISIGGTAWYTWWDASWAHASGGKLTTKSNILYGPVLSLSFPKGVTISSLVLQGKFNSKRINYVPANITTNEIVQNRESRNIWRLDSDSHIGYAVTDFFKILAGFKYTYYEYNIYQLVTILYVKGKIWYNEYAPALGIAFNIHLVQGLYLIIQSSVIFNFSVRTVSEYAATTTTPPMLIPYDNGKSKVNRIGSNSTLGFAYHIKPANITISLGGRYQMYKPFSNKNDPEFKYMDHFYGVTASVMYTFHATHKNPECESDKAK